ncbi:hypothetical protein GCM10020358_81670 [Amorphoplanes nipponensis]|uniref:Uncharacterized protein n=1 Tax=Actinoplanes nipponensis TaxID=135950 RepID=A0A919MIV9_9ACTN|nr:hypothetical protein [Actinoplanes nipponensis]GIE46821.1 hypothetical protein Ani05nite_03550 [Actinoplanes nipponensis]
MTTILDRVVRWCLDPDGDLYGDERERFRWYEGMTTAASLQALLLPWAAAVMVLPLGKASVLPLAVMLAAAWAPQMLATLYVGRRQVDTTPRTWSAKRILLFVLNVVPYALFVVGALYVSRPGDSSWQGAAFGSAFGALLGVAATVVKGRRRARREALAGDED